MANFPSSVSTNSNLYIAVNGVQTTLAASISPTDTTIQLTSTTGFPAVGYVTIDNSEVVLYSGISGPNLTGCTRGADGTTAAAHSLGVTVGATIVAAHHNLLKDEIIAIETALGANYAQASANTPNAVVQRDGSGNFSAGTITAALNGNATSATTATKATNIAGGAAGEVPYQSAVDTTGFSPVGTTGDLLTSGGSGAPTWSTPTAAPTASTIMKRDANSNVRVNTLIENFTTTVTAAGTTNLTAASSPLQQFTGTTTQNVVLPDATTLSSGYQISILNRSTGSVTVKDNSGAALLTIAANSQTTFTVTNISSAAGVWDASTSSGGSAVVNFVRYIVGTSSGAYTGSTTVFDLPFAYIQDGKTLQVFYNGQMLSSSNYTETTSSEVTMSTALVTGGEVVFRTVSSGAAASTVTFFREDYVVGTPLNNYTGSLTVFNLVNSYIPGGLALGVYVDGDLQTKGATVDYLETNPTTVTFNNSLVSGQKVSFLFAQAIAPAGTVNTGVAGEVAYYPTSTAQVAPLPGITTTQLVNLLNILAYRRPTMLWIDGNTIDVENNTGTANQTTIMFPDGDVRSVTENTGVTMKYRRFIITNTANFTSGTEGGGLRSSLSRTANTYYALYAVKSQINAANFVLVGDTTFPTQSNVSTLNSAYGANSWVYLGPVANGDNSGSTNTILSFEHTGNRIHFVNSLTVSVGTACGIRLANAGAGNFFLAVTPGFGTNIASSQVPPTVMQANLTLTLNASSSVGYDLTIGTGSRIPILGITAGQLAIYAETEFRAIDSSASSLQWHNATTGYAKDINISDLFDLALSGGPFGQVVQG